jgi:hypothetical protein
MGPRIWRAGSEWPFDWDQNAKPEPMLAIPSDLATAVGQWHADTRRGEWRRTNQRLESSINSPPLATPLENVRRS